MERLFNYRFIRTYKQRKNKNCVDKQHMSDYSYIFCKKPKNAKIKKKYFALFCVCLFWSSHQINFEIKQSAAPGRLFQSHTVWRTLQSSAFYFYFGARLVSKQNSPLGE